MMPSRLGRGGKHQRIAKETMQVQIAYQFDSEQDAYRFLNSLKHWPVAEVDARFYRGADSVKVSYEYAAGGFDATSSELDDLAARHNGREIN